MITAWKPETLHRIMDLQWTTEPPTEEGWYWVKNKYTGAHDIEPVYLVKVTHIENQVVWSIEINGGSGEDFSYFSHWLGPLPVPEPPQETCLDCKKVFQVGQPMMPVEGGYVCESCMVERRKTLA